MLLKTSTTKEIEIDVPIPSFFRQNGYHRAILSETDYRQIFDLAGRVSVSMDDINSLGNKRDIVESFEYWEKISEEEFYQKWQSVLASMSLSPVLVETENDIPAELFTASNGHGGLAD